jgi:CDP-archaeol synthase
MADIVLPVASAFERERLKIGFEISVEAQSLIHLRPAVVPPLGGTRPDTGVGLEQLRASPGGVRLSPQARYAKHAEADANGIPRGFATPSRKVELYSQTFFQHGCARMIRPMHPLALARLLILLTLANGAPVMAKRIFGKRFSMPLDGNRHFIDGRPLFGTSKTIRGILASLAVTVGLAPIFGLDVGAGLLSATAAMIGDLFSSFIKRRMGLPPSSRAIGLDQVPESLFPLLACAPLFSLTGGDIAAGCAIFFVGELTVSHVLFRLGLRERPY